MSGQKGRVAAQRGQQGKRPGKTKGALRRREVTRRSGFRVHGETTGGEFRRVDVPGHRLERGAELRVVFRFPRVSKGALLGFGAWYVASPGVEVSVSGGPEHLTRTDFGGGSWNKVGSIWMSDVDGVASDVVVSFVAKRATDVAVYAASCGGVRHMYLDKARPALLRNMYEFAPEALFIADGYVGSVDVGVSGTAEQVHAEALLKSCNRCGRYLPFNFPAERDQLSFSNHCVAAHRRPCKHASFGRLKNPDAGTELKLDYGFQLECRFCKKFEVNAAHNPRRTAAQMKEDGARRRAFEALLQGLFGKAKQLEHRVHAGSELADDVWERFGRECFKCGRRLASAKQMHLDHTRPLALLWPLDSSATALCKTCNSKKRDRAPAEFYSRKQLKSLSRLTGIPLADLENVGPNERALARLMQRKTWFFSAFLQQPEMLKVRDGKTTGRLVLKALQKALAKSPKLRSIDLAAEYEAFLKTSPR